MKQSIKIFCLFTLLILSQFSCHQETQNNNEEVGPQPNHYMYAQRAYPTGKIPKNQVKLAAKRANQSYFSNQKSRTMDWDLKGPTNIGGRITDIEFHPEKFGTWYAASASGGLYITEDEGQTWTSNFGTGFQSDEPILGNSIGDLAISTSNSDILYIGTGESNAGGGSLAYDGFGVYKSIDGAESWSYAGLENAGSIGRIAIHPNNPDILFVATMGNLFGDDNNRGLYRSTNGGTSWEQVLFVDEMTGAIDVVINPENPNIIYAAMWQRVRRPSYRDYGGPSSGVYKSTDGGDNWEELTNGLPIAGDEKGRIGLALAASEPNIVMAFYAERDGGLQGVYRTEDHGENWIQKSNGNIFDVPFMWWFGKINIDVNDADIIYLTSILPYKSLDGGDSWLGVFNNAHVDQHALISHPQNKDLVVCGNDGGIYISYDQGTNHFKVNDLPITQFYTCSYDPQNPSRIYGGTQDNNPMRTFGEIDEWETFFGGDGFVTLVDPSNSLTIYTESQYGNFAKSIDGGNSFMQSTNGVSTTDRRNWQTPYIISPHNTNTLYLGTQKLYKTTNAASTWNPISEDLSNGPYNGNLIYGTITAIDESPLVPGLLITGTDDGNIWVSEDDGNSWLDRSDGIPSRWITDVKADLFNPDRLYVCVSGYRYGEGQSGNIFMSDDKGQNWQDISGTIQSPINALSIDPRGNYIYVGTDYGVYYSDLESEWEILGHGLRPSIITDLALHEPSLKLLAATYGHSMHEFDLNQLDPVDVKDQVFDNLLVFPNPTSDEVTIQGNFKYFKISDNNGKQLLTGEIKSNKVSISSMQNGVYYLTLMETSNTKGIVRKIVKI